jgi:hypothetical protein
VKDATDKLRPMWIIESEPPGAQVVRDSDGAILGVTPWHGEQPAGSEPTAVHLRLSGYSERTLFLQPGSDVVYSPTLAAKSRRAHSRGPVKAPPGPKDASGVSPPKQDVKHGQPEIAD